MKISDMTVVITGLNGAPESALMDYYSNHVVLVVETIWNLSKNFYNSRSSIIEMGPLGYHSINNAINNTDEKFSMGNHVKKTSGKTLYV